MNFTQRTITEISEEMGKLKILGRKQISSVNIFFSYRDGWI